MIVLSWRTVSALPICFSGGTSGDTPPRPCRPWHDAQANWTKRCAPIATWGATRVAAGAASALSDRRWLPSTAIEIAGRATARTRAARRRGFMRPGIHRRAQADHPGDPATSISTKPQRRLRSHQLEFVEAHRVAALRRAHLDERVAREVLRVRVREVRGVAEPRRPPVGGDELGRHVDEVRLRAE